tara:strand:- start:203 stop:499 length:297 start_codon:yes stop_codon:yes gene_type:complete
LCDDNLLILNIRNNINGDFKKVERLSELKPGAFINIDWNNKSIMLPLSLKKGTLSFTDNKWDWRYEIDKKGIVNEKEPTLYEIELNNNIKHECTINSD